MSSPKNALEDQLATLTREFVGKLVDTLRNASLADVAALSSDSGASRARPERAARTAKPREASSSAKAAPTSSASGSGGGGRQTAARRVEMGELLTKALGGARQPMGVRALATELGVDPATLAVPLRELRDAGKIRKHGDKRATTYSLA